MLDLPPYLFKGVIVTHKINEAFVFIRSCQVAGDVFVHTEDLDKDVKKEGVDLVGRTVLFTVKDSGKKSLEASRVELAEESVARSVIDGRIVAWDCRVGEGWVEVQQFGLRMMFVREKLEVSRRKQTKALVGRNVTFELKVDRVLKVEAKNIKLVTSTSCSSAVSLSPSSSFKSSLSIPPDVLASIPTMDMTDLIILFDSQLKTCLLSMTKEQDMAKLVLAVIKREIKLCGLTTIQDKVARMISSNVATLVKSISGCELLHSCLKIFSAKNKSLIVEQLEYICHSSEQLLKLWQLGSSLFSTVLPYMEEAVMSSMASTLSGQYILLATNIRYVAALCSFVARIGPFHLARQVLGEVEDELVTLSYDKFGHQLVRVFLKHGQADVQEQVVISLSSQVVDLSCHPHGHSVIVSCIKNSSDQQQIVLMEIICNMANTPMVRLAKDQYGHKVVLAMLEVSRHRQILNTLRSAVLVKQEEVMGTDFGREVVTTMRTKYRTAS